MFRRSQTADVLRHVSHYVIIERILLVTSFYFPALFLKTVQFQRHLVFWRKIDGQFYYVTRIWLY